MRVTRSKRPVAKRPGTVSRKIIRRANARLDTAKSFTTVHGTFPSRASRHSSKGNRPLPFICKITSAPAASAAQIAPAASSAALTLPAKRR